MNLLDPGLTIVLTGRLFFLLHSYMVCGCLHDTAGRVGATGDGHGCGRLYSYAPPGCWTPSVEKLASRAPRPTAPFSRSSRCAAAHSAPASNNCRLPCQLGACSASVSFLAWASQAAKTEPRATYCGPSLFFVSLEHALYLCFVSVND